MPPARFSTPPKKPPGWRARQFSRWAGWATSTRLPLGASGATPRSTKSAPALRRFVAGSLVGNYFKKPTRRNAKPNLDVRNLPRRRLSLALRPYGPHERDVVRRQVRRGDLESLLRYRCHARVPEGEAARHGRRASGNHL